MENWRSVKGFKGVSFQKDRNMWVSYLDLYGKRITIGEFKTEEEAKKERENYINNLETINYEKFI